MNKISRILFVLVPAIFLFPGFVNSAEKVSKSIDVYPAILERNIEAGSTGKFEVNVANSTSQEYEFTAYFLEPQSSQMNGIISRNEIGWMKLNGATDNTFKVRPNTSNVIVIDYVSPADLRIGGYYPTLVLKYRAVGQPITTTDSTSLDSEIVVQFILSVTSQKNALSSDVSIEKFEALETNLFTPQVKLEVKIDNTGVVHSRTNGVIKFYDPNGVEQNGTKVVNQDLKLIMPTFSIDELVEWKKEAANYFSPIGFYKAVLTIRDPENGVEKNQEVTFFVLPIEYIVCSLAGVLVMGLAIYIVKSRSNKLRKVTKHLVCVVLFTLFGTILTTTPFFRSNIFADETSTSTYKIIDTNFGPIGGQTQNSGGQKIMVTGGNATSSERIQSSQYSIGPGSSSQWMANVPLISCFETTTNGATSCSKASVNPAGMVMVCGYSGCYDKARFEINPQGNNVSTLYSIQITTDPLWNYGSWMYLHNDFTLGAFASHSLSDYQTKAYWENTYDANVVGLVPGTTYYIRATALNQDYTESYTSPVLSAITGYPMISFDIDIADSTGVSAESNAPYSISFGTVSLFSVQKATNKIWFDVGTNISSGVKLDAISNYDGLYNVSQNYLLPSRTGLLTNYTEGFGVNTFYTGQTYLGPLVATSNYSDSNNIVGPISAISAEVYNSSHQPIYGGRGGVNILSIRDVQTATGDYSNAVTIRITSEFP